MSIKEESSYYFSNTVVHTVSTAFKISREIHCIIIFLFFLTSFHHISNFFWNSKHLNLRLVSFCMLLSISQLFDQFYASQSEINKCNAYREKMHGKPYNIEELNKMLSLMRVRTELWKYLESSAAAIDDWKLKVFKKVKKHLLMLWFKGITLPLYGNCSHTILFLKGSTCMYPHIPGEIFTLCTAVQISKRTLLNNLRKVTSHVTFNIL